MFIFKGFCPNLLSDSSFPNKRGNWVILMKKNVCQMVSVHLTNTLIFNYYYIAIKKILHTQLKGGKNDLFSSQDFSIMCMWV